MTNGLQGEPMNRDQIKRMMGDEPEKDHPLVITLYYLLWAILAVWILGW